MSSLATSPAASTETATASVGNSEMLSPLATTSASTDTATASVGNSIIALPTAVEFQIEG